MSLYSRKKKFPYLYDSMHTIQELEDMYDRTDDREKKRQIRKLINERFDPHKPKSDAYEWSQKHNFALFMLGGIKGNIGAVCRELGALFSQRRIINGVYKRYELEYKEALTEILEIQKKLNSLEKKLRAISALRKEDKIDDRANRS